jgi:hypothetical protein
MNRISLREKLRAEGVADGRYELTGLHKADRADLGFYFLESREGAWVVGMAERGRRDVMARFGTEAEACDYLYQKLTWREPAPIVQTPAQEARGRRITEEMTARIKEMMRRGRSAGEDGADGG